MVMVLSDVVMPTSVIAAGVRGVNMRKNTRVTNSAGYTQANVIWQRTLRKYEVGTVPLSVSQWQAIEGLFEVTEGGAFGFLMLDPKDQTVSTTEGFLRAYTGGVLSGSAGFGAGVPSYRMFKRYTSAGSTRTKDRRISRPLAINVTRNGGAVTVGAAAGNIAVTPTTGAVTFVADTFENVVSFVVGAATRINFASGAGMVASIAVGQLVYVTGVSGTAAAALNGIAHTVATKGADFITISTGTVGLTATGGTTFKYPQTSDSLGWSGTFYVPVQFENDQIDFDIVAGGQAASRFISGPSVSLVEVME